MNRMSSVMSSVMSLSASTASRSTVPAQAHLTEAAVSQQLRQSSAARCRLIAACGAAVSDVMSVT